MVKRLFIEGKLGSQSGKLGSQSGKLGSKILYRPLKYVVSKSS